MAKYGNLEDFLKDIHISLEVDGLHEKNINRVVQMFQKSNQFNLTTRRHGERDLKRILSEGASSVSLRIRMLLDPKASFRWSSSFPTGRTWRWKAGS